mmetsp:Transcript_94016/g.115109  ORF Transcript_94016/g.115109 Transcript_94016/m.115109 type:complete len:81 (-) Transcript_94016:72-314(-)
MSTQSPGLFLDTKEFVNAIEYELSVYPYLIDYINKHSNNVDLMIKKYINYINNIKINSKTKHVNTESRIVSGYKRICECN